MARFDPRLTPARPDLAAEHLRGEVEAAAFVTGRPMHVTQGIADLRHEPTPDAGIDTQALYGENVTLYEDHEGWGWVQLARDNYVGYIGMTALAEGYVQPTHRINTNRSFIYPGPNMKLPPRDGLPLGALVRIDGLSGDYARLVYSGFIFAGHLKACGVEEGDFVEVAERLLHTPYLWGGKSSLGLDCSGLVQLSLGQAGVLAPRDTDMQQDVLGAPVAFDDTLSGLQRGDLVFWKGHVGIMRDQSELLHANAYHMLVASEPLAQARDRILAKSFGPITAIKRL
ncbi:MAG TPA: NlpC/P60 family protein [Beijerinckia sp.]|jgi:hypothetical protein|nr:NlpC/P60 family protein [Beijerinckia sp.]